jgi:hypothetical protein
MRRSRGSGPSLPPSAASRGKAHVASRKEAAATAATREQGPARGTGSCSSGAARGGKAQRWEGRGGGARRGHSHADPSLSLPWDTMAEIRRLRLRRRHPAAATPRRRSPPLAAPPASTLTPPLSSRRYPPPRRACPAPSGLPHLLARGATVPPPPSAGESRRCVDLAPDLGGALPESRIERQRGREQEREA